jgi:hypothetical protein
MELTAATLCVAFNSGSAKSALTISLLRLSTGDFRRVEMEDVLAVVEGSVHLKGVQPTPTGFVVLRDENVTYTEIVYVCVQNSCHLGLLNRRDISTEFSA